MYIPNQFRNENLTQVRSFLEANSFGMLVSVLDGRPWASHIPLELSLDHALLTGHLSKANPQAKTLTEGQEVLAIFTGPHTYVSSSWYSHENAPTWNYVAVHVYGTLSLLDEAEVYESLKQLVDKYERASERPIRMENFSEKMLAQMRGIVCFKITIGDIQAAYKLSQNRNDHDHQNIVAELSKRPDAMSKQIADLMNNNRKNNI